MSDASLSSESTGPSHGDLTASVVAAYVSHNAMPAADLPALIRQIHNAFETLKSGVSMSAPAAAQPAVPVKSSVKDDYLISLIDGKRYKSLKRHIGVHGLTPNDYRERYGLPPDYPMVCKTYSLQRGELAKRMGLGKKVPLVEG